MPKLSTLDDLVVRANVSNDQATLDRYARALDTATLRLENMFRTSFLRATNFENTFAINCRVRPLIEGGIFLYSGNMFVTGTPTLRWGLTVAEAQAVTAEALTITMKDATRGLFFLAEEHFPGSALFPRQQSWIEEFYVVLKYDYGFTLPASPGGDPPNDVYESVPEGLRELAETEALNIVQQMHPCKKEDGEYKPQCIDPYTWKFDRQRGSAYWPIL